MKCLITLFLFFAYPLLGFTQPHGEEAEVFMLINEARVNPKMFLQKYRAEISKYEPKFLILLERSTSIEKIIWDEHMALNCKEQVYGNLNPQYNGANILCAKSWSSGSVSQNQKPIFFLCKTYTHVMNENDMYFGFYKDTKGYAIFWGGTCNPRKYQFASSKNIDTTKVDFKKINTAKNEASLNFVENEMIKEINFARQYPDIYASIVAKYLAEESLNWGGLDKETYDAGMELIEELKAMKPVQILYPKKCLYESAKRHGLDCKKRGFTDHIGSDGSGPFQRISSYCSDALRGGENIVGGNNNARNLVILLLIDAGISSRGHRYNMLDPQWKYVGCYGYENGNIYNYIQNFSTQ